MKLEDQVVSLELAKRLKELGVNQESLFYWVERRGFGSEYGTDFGDPELRISPHHVSSLIALEPDRRPDGQFYRSFSAFTVAELGEMLPQLLPMKKHEHHYGRLTLWRVNDNWQLAYNLESKQCFEIDSWDKSMANAFAKMLIHLIEKGIVTP